MLLFSPSAGHVMDRMSILELKIEAARSRASATRDFEIEHMACLEAIARKATRLTEAEVVESHSLYAQLREQNQKQWNFEDAIHKALEEMSEYPLYEDLILIAELAKGTHLGNKRRSELVSAIDTLFGEHTERKMYA